MESESDHNDTEKLGFSKFSILSNHEKTNHFEVLEANSQFKNICCIQKARNKEEENQIINLWLNKKNKKLVALFNETLEQGKINKFTYHNEENNKWYNVILINEKNTFLTAIF
ncbi:MAG: hypothetical protein JXR65_05105 [Bacteroidales bacterium]|nr:hypothetical protein [Bacteroidales bacterium]